MKVKEISDTTDEDTLQYDKGGMFTDLIERKVIEGKFLYLIG